MGDSNLYNAERMVAYLQGYEETWVSAGRLNEISRAYGLPTAKIRPLQKFARSLGWNIEARQIKEYRSLKRVLVWYYRAVRVEDARKSAWIRHLDHTEYLRVGNWRMAIYAPDGRRLTSPFRGPFRVCVYQYDELGESPICQYSHKARHSTIAAARKAAWQLLQDAVEGRAKA
jgi:hypothetical protein